MMHKTGHTHEEPVEHTQMNTSSDRSFGLVFTIVFLIVGSWPLFRGELALQWWALGLALLLLLVSLLKPGLLAPVNFLWTKFGLLLHHIVNPVIMGLIFLLTMLPVGLIMRIAGKDFLRLEKDHGAKSYWINREPPGPAPETMRNQF